MADHNPYSNDAGFDELAGPERTSLLAIMSLVMSLICCIPGLGLLGAGLGVGSLIGISGSRGRVGGKGLATAGIIIGVLITVAWVGGYAAFQAGVKQLLVGSGDIIKAVDTADYATFRTLTLSPASDLTDDEYAAFVAAYQAQLGAYQGVPATPFEYFGSFADPAVGQSMQAMQNLGGNVQNPVPVPMDFANSKAVVLLIADPSTGNPLEPIDLIIMMPDGSLVQLSDFAAGGAAGGGGAAPAGVPAPGEGDADDGEAGEDGSGEDEPADDDGP